MVQVGQRYETRVVGTQSWCDTFCRARTSFPIGGATHSTDQNASIAQWKCYQSQYDLPYAKVHPKEPFAYGDASLVADQGRNTYVARYARYAHNAGTALVPLTPA